MATFLPRRAVLSGGLLLAAFSLAACAKKEAVEPTVPYGTGLTSTWQLTSRECRCVATPLPDERIVFADSKFQCYEGTQQVAQGHYLLLATSPMLCGFTPAGPGLRLVEQTVPISPDGYDVSYTLTGDTLVLQASPCDAPRDTYQRLK